MVTQRNLQLRTMPFTTLFGMDYRTAALLRVCFALILLYDVFARWDWVMQMLSNYGIYPMQLWGSDMAGWTFSLYGFSGTEAWAYTLLAIEGILAFLLLIGYRTRIVTVLLWFMLISLQRRNNMIMSGADDLLRVLLFWAMFLPMGARYSVDAALDNSPENTPHRTSNHFFSFAAMAIMFQAICLYLYTGTLKWHPFWHENGVSVLLSLNADQYAADFGKLFKSVPLFTYFATKFVITMELLAPFLMFFPWAQWRVRLVTMFLLICMHFGFLLMLEVGPFPFISILSLLTFTPGVVWDKLEAFFDKPSRRGITLFYDADCGFCKKTCHLLRTFAILPHTKIRPATDVAEVQKTLEENFSWVVESAEGKRYIKWDAMRYYLCQSPVLFPIGYLFKVPGFAQLGDGLYYLIARFRGAMGWFYGKALPWRPLKTTLSKPTETLVALLAFTTIWWWNLDVIGNKDHGRVEEIKKIASWIPKYPKQPYEKFSIFFPASFHHPVYLYQVWSMFAPFPMTYDGWYVIDGVLEDGNFVDVWRAEAGPVNWDKPDSMKPMYPYWRWRKYMTNIFQDSMLGHMRYFAGYVCMAWNNRRMSPFGKELPDSMPRLRSFNITYVREITQVNTESTVYDIVPGEPDELLLWQHYCFAEDLPQQ